MRTGINNFCLNRGHESVFEVQGEVTRAEKREEGKMTKVEMTNYGEVKGKKIWMIMPER